MSGPDWIEYCEPRKIIDFVIVNGTESAVTEEGLRFHINAFLKLGYQFHGFTYSMPNDEIYHYQAMVKYAD
jgi:hypothetical protein